MNKRWLSIANFVLSGLLCLTAAHNGLRAEDSSSLDSYPVRKHHPRIFLLPNDISALQQRIVGEPAFKASYNRLKKEADKILRQPASHYEIPDGKRLLSVSRRVLHRVRTLSLTYLLSRDKQYLQRCWKEVESAAAFKDWNPSHFLDTAEMTHAFAIAYDWLYADWSPRQRETIANAIVHLGLTPGLKCYRNESRSRWWVQTTSNWNQVCNAGMTLGALAVYDEHRDLAAEILRSALKSIHRSMDVFAPDGGYVEGPGYWGYGVSYNVFMLAALQSALGTDYGLSHKKGFDKTALFPIYVIGPTGYPFNFADCGYRRPSRVAPIWWLGNRFHIPAALSFAAKWSGADAMDLIWRREAPAKMPELPRAKYWRRVELVSMRGAWNDPNAVFVAFKGGSPSVNHGHADLGAFVLDAAGVRWAVDLGSDNYNLPGYFSRKGRWQYYRMRAESHNTLVINPDKSAGQIVRAEAKITRFADEANRSLGVVDLTAAYAPHVSHLERQIQLVDGKTVVIQDDLTASSQPVELWWSMHTPATVQIEKSGRRAELHRDGKTLYVQLVSPPEARLTVRSATPLPTSPNPPGQKKNNGVRALTIHIEKVQKIRLVVKMSPLAFGKHP